MGDSLRAILRPQLLQDVLHVILDGVVADGEYLSDGSIGMPLTDELEEFSRLKPVEETTLKISPGLIPDAQKALYFSILGMNGEKEIARSSLMEIPNY